MGFGFIRPQRLYNDDELIQLALEKKKERKARGMSLVELLKEYPIGKDYRFTCVDMATPVKIVAEHDGEYWAVNNLGAHITITKTMAEKGWSLLVEKKVQKYEAWFNAYVDASVPQIFYKKAEEEFVRTNFHRLEQFDFEIETYE